MELVSWDGNNINDGTNYVAILDAGVYGLPPVDPQLGERHGAWPLIGGLERHGRIINFEIYIRGTPLATMQKQLAQWFDPEDEDPKQLIGEDSGGGNDRFIEGICIALDEVPNSAGLHYVVSIQVHGDVRWRETSITTASAWSVTASGQTKVIANNGEDKAFPILKIVPTGARSSGGFAYKRFVALRWEKNQSAANYPIDIVDNTFDTASLTPTKMQADGDDLRVYVNGVEVERWLQDMDDATTQVWCNIDFEADIDTTLDGAINNSVTEFNVNESINDMPTSGILYIGTELITYTAKDNQSKEFSGCTRGAKGTTAAAHSDGDGVNWIQHDVWIYYGNSSLTAPSVDDDNKPIISLISTNTSWDYNNFGDNNGKRSGRWSFEEVVGSFPSQYTANQASNADPWSELGVTATLAYDEVRMFVINPCGILSANFANGEYKLSSGGGSEIWIQSYKSSVWNDEYEYTPTTEDFTWRSWSRNETLDTGARGVAMLLRKTAAPGLSFLEVSDVTLTLDSTKTPTIVLGAEQSNYSLTATITNNTTGDAVEIDYEMILNQELEVDSDDKTVILLDTGESAMNALDLVGGARKRWLPLDVGNNTLQLDDTGTGNLTITVTWWERYYQ